jgi:hypothetical protein
MQVALKLLGGSIARNPGTEAGRSETIGGERPAGGTFGTARRWPERSPGRDAAPAATGMSGLTR